MNLSETQTLLEYLTRYYPRLMTDAKAEYWVKPLTLANISLASAKSAADQYVQTSKYSPKVADIIEICKKQRPAPKAKATPLSFEARVQAYQQKERCGLVIAMEKSETGARSYQWRSIKHCLRVGTVVKRNRANPSQTFPVPIYQTKVDFCMDKLGAARMNYELREFIAQRPVNLALNYGGWTEGFNEKVDILLREALGGEDDARRGDTNGRGLADSDPTSETGGPPL